MLNYNNHWEEQNNFRQNEPLGNFLKGVRKIIVIKSTINIYHKYTLNGCLGVCLLVGCLHSINVNRLNRSSSTLFLDLTRPQGRFLRFVDAKNYKNFLPNFWIFVKLRKSMRKNFKSAKFVIIVIYRIEMQKDCATIKNKDKS